MSDAIFSGPYVLAGTAPVSPEQVSQAEDVTNPRDLGENRAYRIGLADSAREVDYSGQDQDPQPFAPPIQRVGRDPYAIGGGFDTFLDNQA